MDTRDVDVVSTAGSEVGSIDNVSLFSNSSDQKKEKSIFPEENSGKSSLIIEAINETIAEQNARSKEISELLSFLEIEPKLMPKHIQDTWSNVEGILRAEGLSKVDEVSLKIRMEQRRRDSMKKAREERKLKGRYDSLCQRHSSILKEQAKVRESTESLQTFVETEWVNIEEEYANRIFMATKLNDYRQTADKLEQSLQQQVITDHCPNKILEKYETYLKLVEKSSALDKELNKYGDLPANLSEARIMVEEKERYLKDLEHAIFEKMQS